QLPSAAAPPRDAGARCTLDHLGIAVKSLDEAIAFYQALGLTVTGRGSGFQDDLLARLPLGDSRIELLQPVSPASALTHFLEARGPGLHHIALCVPDLA